ncbi:MAG TPA: AAA family ATPase [Steroidobacteraceae bacterium]|nr:AAA family ATPase [Steroidobacteraceae bacterium]
MSIIENALEKVRRATPAAGAPVPLPPDASADLSSRVGVSPRRRIAIDIDQLRAKGELPEAAQERRFADYYREIKRPLVHAMLTADARPDERLVLITSALPAEGKTFTALNLALSVARERDVSVLLVDADVPKGHLSRTFGLKDAPGLLDALSNETIDIDSLVVGTDLGGLEFLPAGKLVEGAAELLASARMNQIATRLARHPRRLVIFDCAPLLASSEARALKQIPGQFLIVTRAGRTPRQALLDAIALIDNNKLHGLVLNDAHGASADDYYTHYGYSDYGAGR